MNTTAPRCMQCGENPRIRFECSEGSVQYHPLCEECHQDLRKESGLRGVSQAADLRPRRPMNLLELVVSKTRYLALGLAITSLVQVPLMYLAGARTAAFVHSALVLFWGPLAAVGFRLGRKA